jgi:hypothetical protein
MAANLFFIPALAFLLGCAHTSSEILIPQGVATLKTAEQFVAIERIDGGTVTDVFGVPKRLRNTTLPPGKHTVTVTYRTAIDEMNSWYKYELTAEAGHIYFVKADAERPGLMRAFVKSAFIGGNPDLARLWIVDIASQVAVGKLLASSGEPAKGGTQIGIQGSFSWRLPEKDRIILARNQDGVRAEWQERANEINGVTIQTFPLKDTDASIVHQAKERIGQAKSSSDAIREIEESDEIVKVQGGICLRHHSYAVFSQPRRDRSTAPPAAILIELTINALLSHRVFVDSYEYSCRSSIKAGYGITFKFAQQAGHSERNPMIATQAEDLFAQLKF